MSKILGERSMISCYIIEVAGKNFSWLSEGTWWSSYSLMYYFRSPGAKDQLPGHWRKIFLMFFIQGSHGTVSYLAIFDLLHWWFANIWLLDIIFTISVPH